MDTVYIKIKYKSSLITDPEHLEHFYNYGEHLKNTTIIIITKDNVTVKTVRNRWCERETADSGCCSAAIVTVMGQRPFLCG